MGAPEHCCRGWENSSPASAPGSPQPRPSCEGARAHELLDKVKTKSSLRQLMEVGCHLGFAKMLGHTISGLQATLSICLRLPMRAMSLRSVWAVVFTKNVLFSESPVSRHLVRG